MSEHPLRTQIRQRWINRKPKLLDADILINAHPDILVLFSDLDRIKNDYDQLLQRNNQLVYELDKSRDSHMKRIAELEKEAEVRIEYRKVLEAQRTRLIEEKDFAVAKIKELEKENERLSAENKFNSQARLNLANENASLCLRAESHRRLIRKLLGYLNDSATTANEALCLIRRDIENALEEGK